MEIFLPLKMYEWNGFFNELEKDTIYDIMRLRKRVKNMLGHWSH